MIEEKSITKIDEFVGRKVHIIAYGASYLGMIKKIDYDKGILVMSDGKDTAVIDLERIESFAAADT